ncbi:hypothetical protein [Flaviaesturariibacter aridisoli]|uniref:Uncharacterized protein n=1 Tax=Flaviaesturariibacter aridisoli TaxID=2545761 RepID=A0A4R4DZG3_9BACT|nr:hypothetical protein [Flaviaesturariibacter aridisoli]TCZ67733.1 hypothetical protein E0486_15340 [Flaviaesturariibacter aridisoli]
MNTPKDLEAIIRNRKFVQLFRKLDEFEDKINGFVLAASNDLLLMQTSEEFNLTGFSVFPVDIVQRISSSKTNRFFRHVLKQEGLLDQVGCNVRVELESFGRLFKSLKSAKLSVIVECEAPNVDSFSIGTIKSVGVESVSINYFNAEGFVEERSDKIMYKNITRVTFGDRYNLMFAKYVRPVS